MSPPARDAGPRGADAWRRFAWQLPLATGALLVLATASALSDRSVDAEPAVVVALAVAFGAWQAAWWPWRRESGGWRGHGVLWGLGTIALWTALTALHPAFYLLLFVTFSAFFSATSLRVASALTLVQSIAIAALNLRDAADLGSVVASGLIAGASGLIAIGVGRWIHGIIEQSRERAELIAQLEATRAELAEAERAAGTHAERARWAAEVHDTLAQGFTSIVLLLEAAQATRGPVSDAGASHRIDLAVETARANLAEARNLVADAGPPALAGTSLADAVRRAVADLGEGSEAEVAFVVEGAPRSLSVDQEVALLRVVQESLANVRRHAAAASVRVALRYDEDVVTVEVRDDGRGFDAEAAPSGFGLAGMGRRLQPFGGDVTIESCVGGGTRVEAWLP